VSAAVDGMKVAQGLLRYQLEDVLAEPLRLTKRTESKQKT
jgi:hypothetical protein